VVGGANTWDGGTPTTEIEVEPYGETTGGILRTVKNRKKGSVSKDLATPEYDRRF